MSTFTSVGMEYEFINDQQHLESKELSMMTEIDAQIDSKQQYEKEGIIIKKWKGSDGTFDYIASISMNDYSYLGVINNHLERHKHGLFIDNKLHKYLGNYTNNQRHNLGVYVWSPKTLTDSKIESEMYIGSWKNNRIDGEGLYLWMCEKPDTNDFDLADFDVYMGTIENNCFTRGTYMTKKGDYYYLYHGSFSPDGKKNDTNAYYYSSHDDALVYGTIIDDHFTNGYKAYFKDDPCEIKKLIYCTFNEDGTIKSFKHESELWESIIEKVRNNLNLFHSIIMQDDYFGDIYKKYKNIATVIASSTSLDLYDSSKTFFSFVSAYTNQKIHTLNRLIENQLFSQKNIK